MGLFDGFVERLADAVEPGEEYFYECTACGAGYDAPETACRECGRLVVRVVEPGDPGRVTGPGRRRTKE